MKLLAVCSWITILLVASSPAQDVACVKQAALKKADGLRPLVDRLAKQLWDNSETALLEKKSAGLLGDTLKAEGFHVQRGVGGLPTALVATYGSGRPIIGILAEYDALPGVGNEPVPRQQARADGTTDGHGCGHNLFGAASVCGAIALQRTMQAHHIPGTVRLYGCPAEETVVGKVVMAKAGAFDDLDAAIDWHPWVTTGVKNNPGLAMNSFTVEFFGRSAHGAVNPWDGRSALDAVELMDFGVNLMREHVKPTARIHYVITSGGDAPNVVPRYAKVWYYVRDVDRPLVQGLYDRVLKIAQGAALGTETTCKVTLLTGVHETLLNRTLQQRLQQDLEMVGPPRFTPSEQQFGRALQESLEIERKGFNTTLEPLAEEPEEPSGGSTDVAEVSWIAPTVGFRVATAATGVPWHSWAVTACSGSAAGRQGAVVATKIIALMGVDLLTDAKLLEDAKAEQQEKTGGKPYRSPMADDQTPPPTREMGRRPGQGP